MRGLGDLLTHLDFWGWWVLGLGLMLVEILAPGTFFLWLGFAAIGVGTVLLLVDLPWQAQYLIFAALSAASVLVGRSIMKRRPLQSDEPALNRRGEQLTGGIYPLIEPIVDGKGRIRAGDTTWSVQGPDLPQGARVRVVGADGTVLRVEPAG